VRKRTMQVFQRLQQDDPEGYMTLQRLTGQCVPSVKE
jgi:hypothetical protein